MPCIVVGLAGSFAPSGMTKSGSAQALTGSYATITGWTADTANYPGSTVSSNGVVAQGAKSATLAASLELSGGFSYTATVRILLNGGVVATGSGSSGSPITVSTTATVAPGDIVTVQATGPGVSSPSVETGANSWVRIT